MEVADGIREVKRGAYSAAQPEMLLTNLPSDSEDKYQKVVHPMNNFTLYRSRTNLFSTQKQGLRGCQKTNTALFFCNNRFFVFLATI